MTKKLFFSLFLMFTLVTLNAQEQPIATEESTSEKKEIPANGYPPLVLPDTTVSTTLDIPAIKIESISISSTIYSTIQDPAIKERIKADCEISLGKAIEGRKIIIERSKLIEFGPDMTIVFGEHKIISVKPGSRVGYLYTVEIPYTITIPVEIKATY